MIPAPDQLCDAELEYRLLYSVVVAGKSASFAENAMRAFLECSFQENIGPFAVVREMIESKVLGACIRSARMGNYTKLERAFTEIVAAKLDLRNCTVPDLVKIHGIGPKTASFFIIWTRPDARHAALDTHVLKWLTFLGHKVPRSTPAGDLYGKLERIVLAEADKRGVSARDLDARIWEHCSRTRLKWSQVLDGNRWPSDLWPLRPEEVILNPKPEP